MTSLSANLASRVGNFVRHGPELPFAEIETAHIRTEPTVELGEPRVMFQGSYASEPGGGISYSPAGDGESFIMVRQGDDVPPSGRFEIQNRARALDNTCYLVAPGCGASSLDFTTPAVDGEYTIVADTAGTIVVSS